MEEPDYISTLLDEATLRAAATRIQNRHAQRDETVRKLFEALRD